MNYVLHEHQLETRSEIGHAYVAGKRAIMVQAPTAFGKTVLAVSIINGALNKPKKNEDGTERGQTVCMVVPAISLINQTYEKLMANDIREVGIIQADHPLTNLFMPVQVASVQTLVARKMMMDFDVVLIDEAHRWFKFYEKWLPMLREQGKLVIGLSATPWTKGLGKWFDHHVVAARMGQLIEDGFLAPFRVFNASVRPDLDDVKIVAGDYHEGELAEVMQHEPLIADAVRTWKEKAEGRPTLVFAVDRAHAGKLQKQYQANGIPAGYIDMYTELEERDAIRDQLASGEIKVVCNVDTLTIGVDWPFVSCLQLCRPTKSEMRYVQIVGRVLRVSPETGKKDALIFDHSTTTERLGFVDECYDRMTAGGLDDGKHHKNKTQPKKEDLPRECKVCGYLRPPMVRKCPCCGFEPQPQSDMEFAPGELTEAKRSNRPALPQPTRQLWWSGLLQIAKERGYSKGWTYHKFKEWNNGVGPGPDINQHVAAEPTPEIRSWVKSRQIAYAKGKAKLANANPSLL
jgi:DNA repair protein RadD